MAAATTKKTTTKTTVAKPNTVGQYTNLAGISNSTKKNLNYYGQGYQQSKNVTQAKNYLDSVLKAKPGAFKSEYDKQIKNLYGQIMDRPDFSYDVNKDPMYQVYKHNYMTQGQAAMQDTVGNAAALTGGYGNSWAGTSGSQAYQEYLQRLNEVVPELENNAYARYAQEGDTMRQNLQMAQGLRDTEYGQYRDTVGDWQADRSYAQSAYDNAYDRDYNAWMAMLSHYSNLAGQENQSYHNTQSEKLARDQFNFQRQQYADQQAAAKKKSSGGSGGGRSTGIGAIQGNPIEHPTGGFLPAVYDQNGGSWRYQGNNTWTNEQEQTTEYVDPKTGERITKYSPGQTVKTDGKTTQSMLQTGKVKVSGGSTGKTGTTGTAGTAGKTGTTGTTGKTGSGAAAKAAIQQFSTNAINEISKLFGGKK